MEHGKRITVLLLVALTVALARESRAHASIVIVLSRDSALYNEAVEGFLEVIRSRAKEIEITTLNLEDLSDNVERIVERTRSQRPEVILTVGSRATQAVSSGVRDVPIIFSMALYPVASGFAQSMNSSGRNITGAAMDVPFEDQFAVLRELLPGLRRVGVLYNPEETGVVVKKAEEVAKRMNLELIAEEVRSELDVPSGLDRLLARRIEALWSVADGAVFTLPSFKLIIRRSVENRLPFMGPIPKFVKSGALVALGCDHRDNGRQAAELTLRVLAGEDPARIPIAAPRKKELSLNLQVADYIGLKIPQSLVDRAQRVFQ